MVEDGSPPHWLIDAARAALGDLQGARPVAGLTLVSRRLEEMNGVTLGLSERVPAGTVLEPVDDGLDPQADTAYGGGNWVPRPYAGAKLLVLVAEILQNAMAGTMDVWGVARPRCTHHAHPAAPVLRDGEAWWICPRTDERLYQIGRGERPRSVSPGPARPAPPRPAGGRLDHDPRRWRRRWR